jgi:hypothetical protein
MTNRLLPAQLNTPEVAIDRGIISCLITVDENNIAEEDIGGPEEKIERINKAQSHRHPASYFVLDANHIEVEKCVDLLDSKCHAASSIRQKYLQPGLLKTKQSLDQNGQNSILSGYSADELIGLVCIGMHFAQRPDSINKKDFVVTIGPFYVPENKRGCAHSIEMSIAVSHLVSVLMEAIYDQLPTRGDMGVVLKCDYSWENADEEVHPFVEQIYQKIELTQEMLMCGFLGYRDAKLETITFRPPRIC